MRIDDELLDRLGTYFDYHKIYEKTGVTFETFVKRYMAGTEYIYV